MHLRTVFRQAKWKRRYTEHSERRRLDTAEVVIEGGVESVLAMVGLWGVGSNVPNI